MRSLGRGSARGGSEFVRQPLGGAGSKSQRDSSSQQSWSKSTDAPSAAPSGGPSAGSPRQPRILRATSGSSMAASRRICAPQRGQRSASTSKTEAKVSASSSTARTSRSARPPTNRVRHCGRRDAPRAARRRPGRGRPSRSAPGDRIPPSPLLVVSLLRPHGASGCRRAVSPDLKSILWWRAFAAAGVSSTHPAARSRIIQ